MCDFDVVTSSPSAAEITLVMQTEEQTALYLLESHLKPNQAERVYQALSIKINSFLFFPGCIWKIVQN